MIHGGNPDQYHALSAEASSKEGVQPHGGTPAAPATTAAHHDSSSPPARRRSSRRYSEYFPLPADGASEPFVAEDDAVFWLPVPSERCRQEKQKEKPNESECWERFREASFLERFTPRIKRQIKRVRAVHLWDHDVQLQESAPSVADEMEMNKYKKNQTKPQGGHQHPPLPVLEKIASNTVESIELRERNAHLGLVGMLLDLRHTVLAVRMENGGEILVDKNADTGVWCRKLARDELLYLWRKYAYSEAVAGGARAEQLQQMEHQTKGVENHWDDHLLVVGGDDEQATTTSSSREQVRVDHVHESKQFTSSSATSTTVRVSRTESLPRIRPGLTFSAFWQAAAATGAFSEPMDRSNCQHFCSELLQKLFLDKWLNLELEPLGHAVSAELVHRVAGGEQGVGEERCGDVDHGASLSLNYSLVTRKEREAGSSSSERMRSQVLGERTISEKAEDERKSTDAAEPHVAEDFTITVDGAAIEPSSVTKMIASPPGEGVLRLSWWMPSLVPAPQPEVSEFRRTMPLPDEQSTSKSAPAAGKEPTTWPVAYVYRVCNLTTDAVRLSYGAISRVVRNAWLNQGYYTPMPIMTKTEATEAATTSRTSSNSAFSGGANLFYDLVFSGLRSSQQQLSGLTLRTGIGTTDSGGTSRGKMTVSMHDIYRIRYLDAGRAGPSSGVVSSRNTQTPLFPLRNQRCADFLQKFGYLDDQFKTEPDPYAFVTKGLLSWWCKTKVISMWPLPWIRTFHLVRDPLLPEAEKRRSTP